MGYILLTPWGAPVLQKNEPDWFTPEAAVGRGFANAQQIPEQEKGGWYFPKELIDSKGVKWIRQIQTGGTEFGSGVICYYPEKESMNVYHVTFDADFNNIFCHETASDKWKLILGMPTFDSAEQMQVEPWKIYLYEQNKKLHFSVRNKKTGNVSVGILSNISVPTTGKLTTDFLEQKKSEILRELSKDYISIDAHSTNFNCVINISTNINEEIFVEIQEPSQATTTEDARSDPANKKRMKRLVKSLFEYQKKRYVDLFGKSYESQHRIIKKENNRYYNVNKDEVLGGDQKSLDAIYHRNVAEEKKKEEKKRKKKAKKKQKKEEKREGKGKQ
jgi:hypothetical protein